MILDPSLAGNPEQLGETIDQVQFSTNQGQLLEGRLLGLKPHAVWFEFCGPEMVLQASQVLEELNIHGNSRSIYRGKATLKSATMTGGVTTCEAALEEPCVPIDLARINTPREFARSGYAAFLAHWSKFCRVTPEYKSAVADLHCFLHDLKLWLDEFELGLRALPGGDRLRLEELLVRELTESATPALSGLFENFEIAARGINADAAAAHLAYCRRELHPFLLTSPFMYRIFAKPLGYAGDYEMVDMILRNASEGGSVFAKVLNLFILAQAPAVAHRNRVQYLLQALMAESQRRLLAGAGCRVFNLGCGPAGEVQQFIRDSELSRKAKLTLLDANAETLHYAEQKLRQEAARAGRWPEIKIIKKSVQQLLKQAGKPKAEGDEFDFVYSAGLFDYLNDRVCRMLIEQAYSMLAPGGLLLVTNVDSSNPIRNIMEHLYDWYLIYRDGRQFARLAEGLPGNPDIRIHAEVTSSNLFLEVRKPSQPA